MWRGQVSEQVLGASSLSGAVYSLSCGSEAGEAEGDAEEHFSDCLFAVLPRLRLLQGLHLWVHNRTRPWAQEMSKGSLEFPSREKQT